MLFRQAVQTYSQGIFKPINPTKYRGDLTNIIYRSSWEKRFFHWADVNPSVLEWSSEEIVIPYRCQTDGRVHRYFVDAYIKIQNSAGAVDSYLVEIKPGAQTVPPKFPGRQTKRYLAEVNTFIKNQSKWTAAEQYASQRGSKFIILTEKELGINNGSRTKHTQ